ncbi:MAG: hypothetical protein VKJ02_02745 [Snowella sp.]|nr:hypothetical protein [Snowella sp.]
MTHSTHHSHSGTSDTYDPHIIPAETAARKEREGSDYKHPSHLVEESATLHTDTGYTVDKEGLTNNYAVEPEMYVETQDHHIVAPEAYQQSQYTIVDCFPDQNRAETVVQDLCLAGLPQPNISILANHYQQGLLNWQDIDKEGGLGRFLHEQLGIDKADSLLYEAYVAKGQFLVIVVGSNEDVLNAQRVFKSKGHKLSEHQPSL